jgi:hypothetical protein
MRHLFVFALCLNAGALACGAAHAQVIRCVDSAGNVSYTDQKCPADTRSAEQVMGPEATDPRLAPPERPPSSSVPPSATRTPQSPPADRFAEERAEAQQRALERQRRAAEYADDSAGTPYPYPYAYPDSRYRQPGPPQDMRPQLRSCDAGGCNDTLGNRYNPNGKLQSYQGLNGQRCQPVGTTVVCR